MAFRQIFNVSCRFFESTANLKMFSIIRTSYRTRERVLPSQALLHLLKFQRIRRTLQAVWINGGTTTDLWKFTKVSCHLFKCLKCANVAQSRTVESHLKKRNGCTVAGFIRWQSVRYCTPWFLNKVYDNNLENQILGFYITNNIDVESSNVWRTPDLPQCKAILKIDWYIKWF